MADWKKSEVRRFVCEALDPVIGPAGFRYVKKSEAFVRKIEGGRQELVLALVDYNPEFWFSFALGVRLDTVQEIINRFSGIAMTSMTQLEHQGLSPEKGLGVWYKVRSLEELWAAMVSTCAMVRERVLPFFEEYKDVRALNRGLNPAGAERAHQLIWPADRRQFDPGNVPYRQMAGIAVAYVARDSRLNDLIAAYGSQLNQLAQDRRSMYQQLADYILSGPADGPQSRQDP